MSDLPLEAGHGICTVACKLVFMRTKTTKPYLILKYQPQLHNTLSAYGINFMRFHGLITFN